MGLPIWPFMPASRAAHLPSAKALAGGHDGDGRQRMVRQGADAAHVQYVVDEGEHPWGCAPKTPLHMPWIPAPRFCGRPRPTDLRSGRTAPVPARRTAGLRIFDYFPCFFPVRVLFALRALSIELDPVVCYTFIIYLFIIIGRLCDGEPPIQTVLGPLAAGKPGGGV